MRGHLFNIFCLSVTLLNTAFSKNIDTLKQFKASGILQSNMAIQQSKPFKLWGRGNAGDKVTINADWLYKPIVTQVDVQGNWLAKINVSSAVPGDFRATKYILSTTKTL